MNFGGKYSSSLPVPSFKAWYYLIIALNNSICRVIINIKSCHFVICVRYYLSVVLIWFYYVFSHISMSHIYMYVYHVNIWMAIYLSLFHRNISYIQVNFKWHILKWLSYGFLLFNYRFFRWKHHWISTVFKKISLIVLVWFFVSSTKQVFINNSLYLRHYMQGFMFEGHHLQPHLVLFEIGHLSIGIIMDLLGILIYDIMYTNPLILRMRNMASKDVKWVA